MTALVLAALAIALVFTVRRAVTATAQRDEALIAAGRWEDRALAAEKRLRHNGLLTPLDEAELGRMLRGEWGTW